MAGEERSDLVASGAMLPTMFGVTGNRRAIGVHPGL